MKIQIILKCFLRVEIFWKNQIKLRDWLIQFTETRGTLLMMRIKALKTHQSLR